MGDEPSVYDVTYVALDFETTGVIPGMSEVVEVGAVKFDLMHEQPIAAFEQLIRPQGSIPRDATAVHGITNEMVARMPSYKYILQDLGMFIGGSVLVAHNAGFDRGFLPRRLRENRVVDTLKLARAMMKKRRYTLAALVESPMNHRAFPDAVSCMSLFRECVRLISRKKGTSLVYLWEIEEN